MGCRKCIKQFTRMIYINERILLELDFDWDSLIDTIEQTTKLLAQNAFSQPIKPYLRFNNPVNRIIAMPAFVGGEINAAGIKWIASFPENTKSNIKRAHSVMILNDPLTGKPTTIINGALVSAIRTASVSGFVLKKYLEVNNSASFNCGIIGFGPIGQMHFQMLNQWIGDRINHFYICDLSENCEETINSYNKKQNITKCQSWEEVFENTNLFVTCTVSSERYVNRKPKKGAIYLNISLRDFHPDFVKNVDVNIVDNWDEVCRENTDVEMAYLRADMDRTDFFEISEILNPNKIFFSINKSIMFNPMGMAVFDIAIAKSYENIAKKKGNFINIEE